MGILTALRRAIIADLDPRLDERFHDIFLANPVTIYDVGAAGGVVTPYPEGPTAWAPVVGFEPHPDSYREIVDAGLAAHVTLHNLALTDRDGPVTFYVGDQQHPTRATNSTGYARRCGRSTISAEKGPN